jgi:hypothetical protein
MRTASGTAERPALERARSEAPVDERHEEVRQPVELPGAEHGDDVRVLQRGGDEDLAPEPVHRHAGGELRPEHLDHHPPAELPLVGHPHARHAAAPELALEDEGFAEMVLDPFLERRHGRPVHGVGSTGRRTPGLTAPARRASSRKCTRAARRPVSARRRGGTPVAVERFPRADHAGSCLNAPDAASPVAASLLAPRSSCAGSTPALLVDPAAATASPPPPPARRAAAAPGARRAQASPRDTARAPSARRR